MIFIIFLNKAFAGWERYSMEDLNAQQWPLIAVGNHCVQISDNTFHHPANISFAILVLHLPHQLGLHQRKREKYCCAAAGICREQVNALHAGAAPWVMANGDMAQLQVLNESWHWNHSLEPLCGVKVQMCPNLCTAGPRALFYWQRMAAACRSLGALDLYVWRKTPCRLQELLVRQTE